ncbi:hypothetical protein SDC9_157678 [bioreactor metagenome]|uniref:Uncharacterized protein n=1 Tax=bioreactor metagenome TaxID=1076179 RepID=A0A645FDC7_9ZZZZ
MDFAFNEMAHKVVMIGHQQLHDQPAAGADIVGVFQNIVGDQQFINGRGSFNEEHGGTSIGQLLITLSHYALTTMTQFMGDG